MFKKIILIFMVSLLITNIIHANPATFKANYVIKKSGITLGIMQTELSYQGNQYQYSRQTTATGIAALLSGDMISEKSKGIVKGNNFQVQHFSSKYKSRKKNEKEQWHFITTTTVSGKLNAKSYLLSVPSHTIDVAILDLKLMQDVAKKTTKLQYTLLDKGELKHYTFQKLGTSQIKVPAGRYETEKIKVIRKGGKRHTTLWLAKKLNYLPVKIQHNDNGSVFLSQLKAYEEGKK